MSSAVLFSCEYPIYTVGQLRDAEFYVAGGGGQAKTGVPNTLVSGGIRRVQVSMRVRAAYGVAIQSAVPSLQHRLCIYSCAGIIIYDSSLPHSHTWYRMTCLASRAVDAGRLGLPASHLLVHICQLWWDVQDSPIDQLNLIFTSTFIKLKQPILFAFMAFRCV